MADFSALKTAIQTYIKQNGNEEITGEILQEILLSMVTTLGDTAINNLVTALTDEVAARQNADGTLQQNITNEATARANGDTALSNRLGSSITTEHPAAEQIGEEAEAREAADTALQGLIDGITDNIENGYVYAGIATPSSTPATGKIFYLALTAGTYTNFGNTVVSQGINILKYNGSAWSLDAFIGIDDTPIPNSPKLVKSGGAFESVMANGSAFDISAHFASGGTLATYADLGAALAALNTLSESYKRGGMSIKFIRSSDNKYVQARLMSNTFTTNVTKWQMVDYKIVAGSMNLVSSGGVGNEFASFSLENNNIYSTEIQIPKRSSELYFQNLSLRSGVTYKIHFKIDRPMSEYRAYAQLRNEANTSNLAELILTGNTTEGDLIYTPSNDVIGHIRIGNESYDIYNTSITIKTNKPESELTSGLVADVDSLKNDINNIGVNFISDKLEYSKNFTIIGTAERLIIQNIKLSSGIKYTFTLNLNTAVSVAGYFSLRNLANTANITGVQIAVGATTATFEYTPSNNVECHLRINNNDSAGISGNVLIENDYTNEEQINPLYGKAITLNGDSICAGDGYVGGYGKIIADKNQMGYENIGVSGGTIAAETYYSEQEPRHWICRTIQNMSANADYAIIEGGVNDALNNRVTLGSISSGYNAVLDDTTFYGAMESVCKQLTIRYQGKKYGFLIVHCVGNYWYYETSNYYKAIIECCKKWGVPYLDLNTEVAPLGRFPTSGNPDLVSIANTYTKNGDGTHPNEQGYKKYYCDKIESWLKTL